MVLLLCESHLEEEEECFLLLIAYETLEKKNTILRMLYVLTVISTFLLHWVSVFFSEDTCPRN